MGKQAVLLNLQIVQLFDDIFDIVVGHEENAFQMTMLCFRLLSKTKDPQSAAVIMQRTC